MSLELYIDVILPIPISKLFTYRLPSSMTVCAGRGSRVVVPFGRKKVVTGIIARLHCASPTGYTVRDAIEVLDSEPTMNEEQLSFCDWVASYYMCSLGEVVHMALPAGLKLTSESRIQLHPAYDPKRIVNFSPKEQLLLKVLQDRTELSYTEAGRAVGQKGVHRLLKSLVDQHVIVLFEELKEKYRPKKIKQVCLQERYLQDDTARQGLFTQLEKHPKQLDVFLAYLAKAQLTQKPSYKGGCLAKGDLLQEGVSATALQTLIKKQIFVEKDQIIPRFRSLGPKIVSPCPVLSPAQNNTLAKIHMDWYHRPVVLLQGVTGSGKTVLYMHLIQEAIQAGGTVLYLLPEIALTTHIVERMAEFFGPQMGVYHSKYSDNERVEVWRSVQEGKISLVVGTRSAIFLPFVNLSLVIVDEEHDTSYKQSALAPRYHARDAAMVLARYHNAKVLLGSATPSLESYFNAQQGKYGLVKLEKRFGEGEMPRIILANLHASHPSKKRQFEEFTAVLHEKLRQTLGRGEQAIIFQNRRGYAPYLSCEVCTWVPTCAQCTVSLTYHQSDRRLRCHYCGYRTQSPAHCIQCGSHKIKNMGFGTEKLEESLQQLFPEARIQRMDLDTTRGKYSYEHIIEAFEQEQVDILVGTQMVTKGLDFSKVSLVGVVDADRLLNFPDFRAHERCFQLLTQVSGRAGRRGQQGEVVIQTFQPQHPLFIKMLSNDYERMYQQEILERETFVYPPYVRLIKIIVKHADEGLLIQAARWLSEQLRRKLGKDVLGPEAPLVAKIRNHHHLHLWVKIAREYVSLPERKKYLSEAVRHMLLQPIFKAIQVIFDVDPV